MRRPSWKIFAEFAQKLLSIVRGETQGIDFAALSQDWLDDAVAAVYNDDLQEELAVLAHQEPSQKILEVGACRGALTSYVLSIFQGIEARTGGIAFSEYTCSYASAAAVDKARQRFSEHQDRMDFKCLDIDQDLIKQGLEPASYDVVFAAGALRIVKDAGSVLQSFLRLLTPGRWLFLCEFTAPD